ncbi:MAG: helix-turn-helix domain-containing protein [Xanthomonadales bacterium]|nr:helix-turn-helix domain-containing protein [Xanthomonadales bacterium]
MERKTFDTAPCSIARSLDVLGDWWNPLIIRECLYGVHRFDEFQKWLDIGRNILTRRLKQLVDEGLLEKRPYQDNPPRFEYHLTDKGYDAAGVLLALMAYGEKWHFENGNEPIRIFDRTSGARVMPALVDARSMRAIDARQLYAGPGPAFPADKSVRRSRFVEYFARQGDGKRPAKTTE